MAISPEQISTAESSLNNTITPSSIEWIFITLIFYFTAITTNYTLMMLWNILKHLWPEVDLLKVYTHDDNDKESWAVVTGATDGIGLGFCEELVSRGFNVCLISRNQAKLDKVKKHLETLIACHQEQQQQSKQQPPLKKQKLLTLQLDFTQIQDNNKFNQLIKELDKLHITILVNNVGVALIKEFEKCEYQESVDLISVNCHTMALLNAYLIKRVNKEMDEKKSSNNSNANRYAIINLSSLAGYNPIPYITLYSSTKAFNRFISEGLSIEYPNIDIVNITPMHVESGGSNVKKQFNIPTSRECARDSLKQLRFRTYASFGYLSHCITGSALLTYLPKWFLRIVSKVEMKKLVDKYYTKKDE